MNVYTGIGSRKTPPEVLKHIAGISKYLALCGWTLRSGGASGADSAFEHGCDKANGRKEIYLPWKGFNDNPSSLFDVSPGAYLAAKEFHLNWESCSQSVKSLLARNSTQVLGLNLDEPSRFIVCWTPDGKETGGTGQALRIAQAYAVPVFNLALHAEKDVYAYALSCRD